MIRDGRPDPVSTRSTRGEMLIFEEDPDFVDENAETLRLSHRNPPECYVTTMAILTMKGGLCFNPDHC